MVKRLWRQGSICSKAGSVGFAILGFLGLILVSWMLLYVLPLIILAAFIAALTNNLHSTRH
jgi:uncharacterized membrane protein